MKRLNHVKLYQHIDILLLLGSVVKLCYQNPPKVWKLVQLWQTACKFHMPYAFHDGLKDHVEYKRRLLVQLVAQPRDDNEHTAVECMHGEEVDACFRRWKHLNSGLSDPKS